MANVQLIEVLSVHSGPITSLYFSNSAANSLWLVWDYEKSSNVNNDAFNMSKQIIACSMSPGQDHMSLTIIDAIITIWNIADTKIKHETHVSNCMQFSKNIMIGVNQSMMLINIHDFH